LVLNSSRNALWQGQISNGKCSLVFEDPVSDTLFFTVDKKGILYILDSGGRKLHVLLPPDRWTCFACGAHQPDAPSKGTCPSCGAQSNKQTLSDSGYREWFDFDLSELRSPLGPIAIDEDGNLYIVSGRNGIVALPLSRHDMWGEKED
jgi:hypothetical protein